MILFICFAGLSVAAILILARSLSPTPRDDRPATVEERLGKLDELKAKGAITATEYESQRQKIISQI